MMPASSAFLLSASLLVTLPPLRAQDTECINQANTFCKSLVGDDSYCKFFQVPHTCNGSTQECGPCQLTSSPTTSAPTSTPSSAPTSTPSSAPPASTPPSQGSCWATKWDADEFCKGENGGESYCRDFSSPHICHIGNQECTICATSSPESSPAPTSTPSTPTASSTALPNTSTPSSPPPPSCFSSLEEADLWCSEANPEGGVCKSWQSPPVCQGGNQSCGLCSEGESEGLTFEKVCASFGLLDPKYCDPEYVQIFIEQIVR